MKKGLGILIAASAVLLAGCHVTDPPETAAATPATNEGAAPEGADPITTLASGAGDTSAAFPAATPPTGKPSVTRLDYWESTRENTHAPFTEHHAGGEHGGEEAAGAPAE